MNITDWLCLQPGWTVGDRWGPGPRDIVPVAPPCLPDTATIGPDPAFALFLLALVAVVAFVLIWHLLRGREDSDD